MARSRPTLPHGHGELLTRPDYSEWRSMAANASTEARSWELDLGGLPIAELRALARAEIVESASDFSSKIGVPLRHVAGSPDSLIMTGHQPDLYHPGVWAKNFLLQRLSEETGALAINLVVDSDAFDTVGITAPCLGDEVRRCTASLSVAPEGTCYGCTPTPGPEEIEAFAQAGDDMLSTLPAPALRRHFNEFCAHLESVAADAENLAEAITFARRRFEASAGTEYLELPVTRMAGCEAFRRFVAHIALDAHNFAEAHNHELEQFREWTGTRSPVQPFPNLEEGEYGVELPFWAIEAKTDGATYGLRARVFAARSGAGVLLRLGDLELELSGEIGEAADQIRDAGFVMVPRALTLTLFVRVVLADLFIHGVGGGGYDRVTDAVIGRYLGIEPPLFAVASLTMYLPLGGHVVSDDEITRVQQALNTLEHNPDQLLSEAAFDSVPERVAATQLAEEKAALVKAISEPDADKRTVGVRIRQVNEELARLLAPMRSEYEEEFVRLLGLKEATEILTDRTYPFCFWSPQEVQDKTR